MPRLIHPQVSKRRYRISSPPATLEPPLTPVVFPQGRVDLPRGSGGPEHDLQRHLPALRTIAAAYLTSDSPRRRIPGCFQAR